MLVANPSVQLSASIQDQRHEPLPSNARTQLIITTARGIYTWNNQGIIELFSLTSEGIAAARRLQSSKDLLAIADSQVIILHDGEKDTKRTYKLKSETHGRVRKLFYHPGKERLFFTTTLQNSVQSFSVKTAELLDAGPVHESPPTVFAVSPACDLMVSASNDPRMIFLSRIAYKQPPLLFIPNCSNAAVEVIAFHPTRPNIFALGFQDGTIAAYNATVLPSSGSVDERYSYARIYGKIAHMNQVHHVQDRPSEHQIAHGLKQCSTITAIQFLADQPCSIVSTGANSNCCITQFERNGDKNCEILRQWQIQTPATSLAILKPEHQISVGQVDGPQDDQERSQTSPVLLAIGTSDGTVLIYNRNGGLLSIRRFRNDSQILDLEWTENFETHTVKKTIASDEMTATSLESPTHTANRSASVPDLVASRGIPLRSSRSSIGSKILVKLHTKENLPEDYLLQTDHTIDDIVEEPNDKSPSSIDGNFVSAEERRASHQFERNRNRSSEATTTSSKTTESPHSEGSSHDPQPGLERSKSEGGTHTQSHIRRTSSRRSSRGSTRKISIPVIPSRPVPRPGGRLALRRIESAKIRRSSVLLQPPVPTEIVSAVTTGQPRFKVVNPGHGLRPRVFRHRSSAVSPFSEVSAPIDTGKSASSNLMRPPLMTPLLSPLSQSAPVQYDRLQRSSWGAESSSGASQLSVFPDPVGLAATTTKNKTKGKEVVNLQHVRRGKSVKVEGSPHTSESGASFHSVLVWTPGAGKQPADPHERVAYEQSVIPPTSLPLKEARKRYEHPEKSNSQVGSDTSATSQVDWFVGEQPGKQPGKYPSSDTIKPKKIARDARPADASAHSHSEAKGASEVSSVMQSPASLNIPRLRKQQTVINLKTRGAETSLSHSSKSGSELPYGEVKAIDLQPQLSTAKAMPGELVDISKVEDHAPREKMSSVSFSKSASSVSSGPRRASHSKSMFDLRQSRHGSTVGSQSTYTLEDVIRVECAALATRIDVGFGEQRAWLQGYLKEENWYAHKLEEENRKFRDELARARRAQNR